MAERADSVGREGIRYLVVGAVNTVLGYGLFLLLLATVGAWVASLPASGQPPLAALGRHSYLAMQWLAWAMMVPFNTTTMRLFVFPSHGRWIHQVVRAYAIYLPAQLLSFLVLWATVGLAGLSPQIGQLVTIAITTVFSYVGHKFFTFRVPLEVGEVPAEELFE